MNGMTTGSEVRTMEKRIDLERRGQPATEIKELNLDNCRSTQINGLTDDFIKLRSLSLINVGLTTLKGFPALPNLRRLELSDNRISGGLNQLQGCPRLKSINLSGNKIKDLETLEPLKSLTELRTLDLFNCEVTNLENYRDSIFDMLKGLVHLDGCDINNEEADDDDDDLLESDEEDGDVDDENEFDGVVGDDDDDDDDDDDLDDLDDESDSEDDYADDDDDDNNDNGDVGLNAGGLGDDSEGDLGDGLNESGLLDDDDDDNVVVADGYHELDDDEFGLDGPETSDLNGDDQGLDDDDNDDDEDGILQQHHGTKRKHDDDDDDDDDEYGD